MRDRLIADEASVMVVRDAGETARGGLAPLTLPAGRPVVWDGRIELVAARAGLSVRPLAGLAARLDPAQRRRLQAAPAAARPALPAVVGPDGAVSCPMFADDSPWRAIWSTCACAPRAERFRKNLRRNFAVVDYLGLNAR